ncbi:MAG: hypothetical protein ACYCYP_01920 [Leptospirales bacterium]
MRSEDVLLAGCRPDESDGLKIRFYPEDGHIKISVIGRSGHEIHSFELDGIADLEELAHVTRRAVMKHRELFPKQDDYLQTVRRILSPQTETHETALLNVK